MELDSSRHNEHVASTIVAKKQQANCLASTLRNNMKIITVEKFIRVQSNRRQKKLEKFINPELTYSKYVNRIGYLDRLYRVFSSIRDQTPIVTTHPDGSSAAGKFINSLHGKLEVDYTKDEKKLLKQYLKQYDDMKLRHAEMDNGN